MELAEYMKTPGALSAADLAKEIGVPHVAQVNQWRNPGLKRKPSPENCVAIERATDGKVSRQDLRPDDWAAIWPELTKPKRPSKKEVARG